MPFDKSSRKIRSCTKFIFTVHLHAIHRKLVVSDKHQIYVIYIQERIPISTM